MRRVNKFIGIVSEASSLSRRSAVNAAMGHVRYMPTTTIMQIESASNGYVRHVITGDIERGDNQ